MATHQQSQQYSCGAATLLCAASELGVAQIPAGPLWASGCALAVNDTCELKLYQVTSPASHYSMPSGIVRCARGLGLKAKALAYNTWTVWGLKKSFKAEIADLKSLAALQEDRHSKSVFKPNNNQRELKILFDRDTKALHYVMVRPNGTVMEPGAGRDYSTIAEVKTALGMHGTGLSVFVQR